MGPGPDGKAALAEPPPSGEAEGGPRGVWVSGISFRPSSYTHNPRRNSRAGSAKELRDKTPPHHHHHRPTQLWPLNTPISTKKGFPAGVNGGLSRRRALAEMLTALPQLVPLPAAPLRDRQAPGPEPDPSDSSPDPGKLPPALPLPDAIPSGRPALAASCPCRLEE